MSFSRLYIDLDKDFVWRLFLAISAIFLFINASDVAFAAESVRNDVVGETLCRLVQNLTGGIARGIATIAIFAVGVGLFLGKLNWGIAAATAAGVGIIFSSKQLVAFLAGEDAYSNCETGSASTV